MKEISIETWDRKSHYEWFSSFSNPCYSMDVRMDITEVLAYAKAHGTSSFATIVYIVGRVLNNIKAFRYRILDGKVWEIPYANVAYTVAVNDEYFVNNRTDMSLGYADFCRVSRNQIDTICKQGKVQTEFNDTTIVDDIYCSCVPWIDFVSVTQPIPDGMPHNNCIPRVCWGRYTTEADGRIRTTFSINVSHALIDGKELSMAFLKLQKAFDDPQKILEEDAIWTK